MRLHTRIATIEPGFVQVRLFGLWLTYSPRAGTGPGRDWHFVVWWRHRRLWPRPMLLGRNRRQP